MSPDGDPGARRARGPMWTRARLERVMRLRFGTRPGDGVDTRAVAAGMGVTQRTVQRWLHAAHGRSRAQIPPRRLQQLIELLLPSEETRRKEAQAARYAELAVVALRLPRGMGVKPAWEKRRWLEQHLVVVLEVQVEDQKIRQLAISRFDSHKTLDELRKRGRLLDYAVVPTRFHATLLSHRALSEVGPWRFQAGPAQVVQGYTQAWLSDAPTTNLGAWAAEVAELGAPPT